MAHNETPMIKQKKKLPLLLVMAVITPGLVIGLLGIYFVSQQKRANELNTLKDLTNQSTHIRDDIETKTLQVLETVYQNIPGNETDFSTPTRVLARVKGIVLSYPIVKNPFLIDSSGQYLFPFTRKTSFPVEIPPFQQATAGTGKNDYLEAENLELKDKKYVAAIRRYLEYLKRNPGQQPIHAYVYNAIGRCYFKLNEYPQAVTYYRRILRQYPTLRREDKSLYFQVLRQTALCYRFMDNRDDALTVYLDLYENILDLQLSRKAAPFEFYKNEALDYLNRFAPREGPNAREKNRFRRARQKDRLENASPLDISLGWLYFESQTGNRLSPSEMNERETSRFTKLQELYSSTDEKTAFYSTLKNQWPTGATPSRSFKITPMALSSSGLPAFISMKKINRPQNTGKDIFFGFMISIDYLRQTLIPEVTKENPGVTSQPSLKLALLDAAGLDPDYKYKLLAIPFREILPGQQLVLLSNREGYIPWVVEKEARLLYGLMLALLLALFLGLYLLYKYITREAELVRLKADFVDNVSHTLKTPLTRMALLAENVQQGWVTEENRKREFFHTISREITLMNQLIGNMLDFSRIEAGKKKYDFQRCSLQEIVRSVVERYGDTLERNRFEVHIEIAGDIPPLELDPEAIAAVTADLIRNAVKYSDKERYIGVRVYRENRWAVLEVEDRGIGIGEKELSEIFKKFHRAADPAVKAREGSGLGLFLAHHAAAAHGGDIHVKSRPGKGSTFRVILPIKNENP